MPCSVGALLLALLAVMAFIALARPSRERMASGPQNVELYDRPYQHYPLYEGRSAVSWDGDGRCQASCGQSPCTVWCR